MTAARVHTHGAEAVDIFYLVSAAGTPLGARQGAEIVASVVTALG